MEVPNYKVLKKLADACRKAGINSFKGFGFEFTLDDNYAPATSKKKPIKVDNSAPTAEERFETDTLSEEDLLFWSAGGTNFDVSAPKEE